MKIPHELISLHVSLREKCRHNQKIVLYKNVPQIVDKTMYELILDVVLNRGV